MKYNFNNKVSFDLILFTLNIEPTDHLCLVHHSFVSNTPKGKRSIVGFGLYYAAISWQYIPESVTISAK